jgi:hypothetical protein
MIVHACNLSYWEVQVGVSEFEASIDKKQETLSEK